MQKSKEEINNVTKEKQENKPKNKPESKKEKISDLNSEEKNEATTRALRDIYYIIIGLAITAALNKCFIQENQVLDIFTVISKYTSTFFLLLAFFPTICRFAHGASLQLDEVLIL